MHLVLYDVIKRRRTVDDGADMTRSALPPEAEEQLRTLAMRSAAVSLATERELRVLLQELAASGVRPLLLKGAGLAHSVYELPAQRVWRDIDLLFRGDEVSSAVRVLRARGYVGPEINLKSLANYECAYRRTDRDGTAYKVDIHWKINNAQQLARATEFRELWDDAIALPRLSPWARTLGYVHAFVLACVHRIGHFHAPFYEDGQPRYAGNHLRWVFDIHLLAEALSREHWSRVIQFALANRLTFACWDSLAAAQDAFRTSVPNDVQAMLRAASASQGRMGTGSRLAWTLANLRALPTLGDRAALLKEVLFPPASFMREKYDLHGQRAALPFWYAYRIVRRGGTAIRTPRKDVGRCE